jgi:hypothetical protein
MSLYHAREGGMLFIYGGFLQITRA